MMVVGWLITDVATKVRGLNQEDLIGGDRWPTLAHVRVNWRQARWAGLTKGSQGSHEF
jgi:hypothetical protein